MSDFKSTPPFDNLDQLLTYEQVSKWLNLSVSTLTKYVHRNEIPFIKLGNRTVRFESSEVRSWLLSKKIGDGHGR